MGWIWPGVAFKFIAGEDLHAGDFVMIIEDRLYNCGMSEADGFVIAPAEKEEHARFYGV